MFKTFCNLILLVTAASVSVGFAQKAEKAPPKKSITVPGSGNAAPPPAPLIYKAPGKNELKEFVSEDKTFQATFSDIPAVTKQNVENGVMTTYRVYRQGSYSIVSTIDVVFDVESSREKIYENVKNTFLQTPQTTIVAEKEFQIDGKTGKEFDVLQDFIYLKVRILVVGARVYEIRNTVTNWHIIREQTKKEFFAETDRFFGSFKHLKSPEKVVPPAPEGFLGEVKDQTYKNTFFNFSFDFPKDWYRINNGEINLARSVGLDVLKTDKDKVNQAFADSMQKEVVIFGVARAPFGSPKNFTFLVGVTKQPSSQITSEMVANATRNFFLTNPKFKINEDVKTVKLGGTSFTTFTIETDLDVAKINQKLYITTRKGYSVSFVISYSSPEEREQLEKILESLKFETK